MTTANVNVTKVLLKRGNTVQNNNYTGVSGELTIDTQLKTLRVHDGVTAGGNAITASGAIGSYSNTNTAAYLASQSITSANIGAFQTLANANAAAQATSIDSINANIGAYQTYANSNAATQATSIDSINANVGAFQTLANANAATQTTEINSLRANITAANTAITNLTSNAAIQATLLDTLTGNAATQSQVLDTLTSNAAAQATSLTTLLGNAVAQQTSLIDLVANAATQAQAIANVTGTYSNANVATYLSAFDGNILPAANVTYSLGSSTRQWKDLWVSNNTIYIGNTPIRVDGGTLLVNGAPVSGGSTYGNANVATYLPTYTGNIAGNIVKNGNVWTFGTNGTTRFPNGTILAPAGQNITMQSDQYAQLVYQNANIAEAPNVPTNTTFAVQPNFATLVVGYRDGNSADQDNTWLWNIDGMTLPEGGTITEGGGISGAIRLTPAGGANSNQALVIYPTGNAEGDHLHLTAGGGSTELYLGNDYHYVKLVDGGNIELRAATANLSSQAAWTFDTTGNVDTIQALGIKVPNGVPTNVAVINSTTGSWELNPRSNLATTGGSGSGLTVNVTETGGYASTIAIATAGTGYNNGDLITVTSGSSNATFTIVIGGRNTWQFGTGGNLTMPQTGYLRVGTGIVAGSLVASPAPVISGFSSISAENFRFQGNGVNILSTVGANSYGNTEVKAYLATEDGVERKIQGYYANLDLGATARLYSYGSSAASFLGHDGFANININYVRAGQGDIQIATNNATYTWVFNNAGNLTLPNGAVLKDTASEAVSFGQNAGQTSQGTAAVAIGQNAGQISQGFGAVAIGGLAGNTSQGDYAVSVGLNSGRTTQGTAAVAVGAYTGYITQGVDAVAIGNSSGYDTQGTNAIAIGASAGTNTQGKSSVAIGQIAGRDAQGNNSVALGFGAGYSTQGANAVAVGSNAGTTNQGNNSIIINATGSALEQTRANTFTVAPVRNDVANVAQVMFYNTTSKEITYGNTISIAGNVNAGQFNFANGVNILSTVGANSYGNTQVATYLSNYNGDINFTSSTAIISNVDVITVGAHIQSPAYQFSNGTSIFDGITGTYSNANVVANLANYVSNIVSTANVTASYFVGNGSALTGITANNTGNIYGTSSNVTLVAGSYSSTFGNTGMVTMPNVTVSGNVTIGNVTVTMATNGYNNWRGNTYANVDNISASVFSNGAPAFGSVSGTLNYFWSSVTNLTGDKFFGNTSTGGTVTTAPITIGTGITLGSGGDTVIVTLQDQDLRRMYTVTYAQTVGSGNCAIVTTRIL